MSEKTTAVVKKDQKSMESAHFGKGGLMIKSFDDLKEFSEMVAKTNLCPEDFKRKPEDVFIAVEWGFELGLTPMNALNSIAVIKGKPCLWGDAVKGLVDNSGLLESYKEEFIGNEYDDDFGVKVTSKRKGREDPIITQFTVADAKKAGLWDAADKYTWRKYPKRMLKARARAFNLRDNFPDVLKGIRIYEEVADYEVIDTEQPQSIEEIESEVLKDIDGDNKIDEPILKENELKQERLLKEKDATGETMTEMPDNDKPGQPQEDIFGKSLNPDDDLPF